MGCCFFVVCNMHTYVISPKVARAAMQSLSWSQHCVRFCFHRWRTYLQPGVMHASSVPFSAWEKAVVKEVC